MGKKVKSSSDPNLAHAHKAGTPVQLVQISKHEVLGMCAFPPLNCEAVLFDRAEKAFDSLKNLLEYVDTIEPSKAQIRYFDDNGRLFQLFESGFLLIVDLYLFFEYFTIRVLNTRKAKDALGENAVEEIEAQTLKEKLARIFKEVIKDESMADHQGYIDLVGVWNDMRSALHHPKRKNTINGDPVDWDKVPFAWLIAGKHIKPYREILSFKEELISALKKEGCFDATPGTLNVRRGIKFEHDIKKPPKT